MRVRPQQASADTPGRRVSRPGPRLRPATHLGHRPEDMRRRGISRATTHRARQSTGHRLPRPSRPHERAFWMSSCSQPPPLPRLVPLRRIRSVGRHHHRRSLAPCRNTPYDMDRTIAIVSLERQDTRPFRIARVVLHQDRSRHSRDGLMNTDVIRRQLIVPVGRHPDLALRDQRPNTLECLAHTRPLFRILPCPARRPASAAAAHGRSIVG